MSELNAYIAPTPDGTGLADYYLKSEADKVVAELEADYKEACGRLQTANLIKDEQLAATRHQKYKRCLAMARWCASRSVNWCFDPADDELHKSDFYEKWKLRWRELAEKFKEAK
jgi:hypothetical protein